MMGRGIFSSSFIDSHVMFLCRRLKAGLYTHTLYVCTMRSNGTGLDGNIYVYTYVYSN